MQTPGWMTITVIVPLALLCGCQQPHLQSGANGSCDEIIAEIQSVRAGDSPRRDALISNLRPCQRTHAKEIIQLMLNEPVSGTAAHYSVLLSNVSRETGEQTSGAVNEAIWNYPNWARAPIVQRSRLASAINNNDSVLTHKLVFRFSKDPDVSVRINAYFVYARPIMEQGKQLARNVTRLQAFEASEENAEAKIALKRLIEKGERYLARNLSGNGQPSSY